MHLLEPSFRFFRPTTIFRRDHRTTVTAALLLIVTYFGLSATMHALMNVLVKINAYSFIYTVLYIEMHIIFCQNVLATSTFRDLICSHQHMLNLWGGSIHTADGANVAKIFNVTAYPFLALVACRQGRTR